MICCNVGPQELSPATPFSVGLAVISGSLLQSNLCRDRDVALYTYSNCDGDPLIPSSFNSFWWIPTLLHIF